MTPLCYSAAVGNAVQLASLCHNLDGICCMSAIYFYLTLWIGNVSYLAPGQQPTTINICDDLHINYTLRHILDVICHYDIMTLSYVHYQPLVTLWIGYVTCLLPTSMLHFGSRKCLTISCARTTSDIHQYFR